MYIVHEAIPSNDPRWHPEMIRVGSFWQYLITEVPDGKNIYTDWLNGEVVTRDVARAYKFTGSRNNEMSIRRQTDIWEEIEAASSETVMGTGPKAIYELTVNDVNNTVQLMRTVIKNHAKNRIADAAKRNAAIAAADAATTIAQCDTVLAIHCH